MMKAVQDAQESGDQQRSSDSTGRQLVHFCIVNVCNGKVISQIADREDLYLQKPEWRSYSVLITFLELSPGPDLIASWIGTCSCV